MLKCPARQDIVSRDPIELPVLIEGLTDERDIGTPRLTEIKKARPAAKIDAYIADTAGAVRTAGNDLSKASFDAGPIRIRREGERLAFEAPPLVRSGPAAEEDAAKVAAALDLDPAEMLAVEWVDNGPGWIVVLLESAERVLELRPGALDFDLGAVGFHPPGSPAAIEVRAWAPVNGFAAEDPVTGSLNASVAQWLLGSGRLAAPYLAHQGAAIDRAGRIHVSQDGDGAIWIGGATETVIAGQLAKTR